MDKKKINKQKLIDYWTNGSDDDYDTMIAMLDSKRYSWALFLGHLVIEKLLKAYFVKVTDNTPPFIHNLLTLAKKSGLELSNDLKRKLTTITAFNLNVRYDDYKMSFHKKCTPEFTSEWIEKIKDLRLWIKKQIK